jgi:ubiquitin carboxyl-terminal hydrolase L3
MEETKATSSSTTVKDVKVQFVGVEMEKPRWLPLESNPEVITTLQQRLGMSPNYEWVDVLSFEEELLAFLPQPIHALIFLYPVRESVYGFLDSSKLSEGKVPACPDDTNTLVEEDEELSEPVDEQLTLQEHRWPFFMKQTISNACGMIALLHALANSLDKLEHDSTGLIARFVQQTKSLSPEQRAKVLETSEDIAQVHEELAQQGQTGTPHIDDEVDLHFVAVVEHEGHVWELDGRKDKPIPHHRTSSKGFLHTAGAICRRWMEDHPLCLNFSAIALADVQ